MDEYTQELLRIESRRQVFANFLMAIIGVGVVVLSLPIVMTCAIVWITFVSALAGTLS